MSERQSRRSFLGLLSAVSAALAAGVRLPDAPVAQAAETAPERPMADSRTPAGLLAMLRELLPQCVAVAWEQTYDSKGFETKVTYRHDNLQARWNRNPLGVDLASVEGGRPIYVEVVNTMPMHDLAYFDEYSKHDSRLYSRELTITWRSPV